MHPFSDAVVSCPIRSGAQNWKLKVVLVLSSFVLLKRKVNFSRAPEHYVGAGMLYVGSKMQKNEKSRVLIIVLWSQ